jgi:hypothetical protein
VLNRGDDIGFPNNLLFMICDGNEFLKRELSGHKGQTELCFLPYEALWIETQSFPLPLWS